MDHHRTGSQEDRPQAYTGDVTAPTPVTLTVHVRVVGWLFEYELDRRDLPLEVLGMYPIVWPDDVSAVAVELTIGNQRRRQLCYREDRR